jgi:hypothetical protein
MGPLEAELAGLQELTIHHLRILWRRVHGSEPPAPLTRDLLARAIAYRMQEQVHGGLAPAARRRLRALARVLDGNDGEAIDPGVPLRAGTRLLRDWGGKTHTVLVTEDGFEYEGERCPLADADRAADHRGALVGPALLPGAAARLPEPPR